MTIDDRWFAMDSVMISDIPSSVVYFYPRLIPLVDIDVTSLDIPVPIRCSIEKMNNEGAFILGETSKQFLSFTMKFYRSAIVFRNFTKY